jgi:hypothetical protein
MMKTIISCVATGANSDQVLEPSMRRALLERQTSKAHAIGRPSVGFSPVAKV